MNFFLGLLLGACAMLVIAEYSCKDKPVELQAAREAFWAKVADGPKRDRIVQAIAKMQAELDRQNRLHKDYHESK